jgi:hypothetical protein
MYIFWKKDLERYQLKSNFFITFFQRYTVEKGDVRFSGLDLDNYLTCIEKVRIIFTIKY